MGARPILAMRGITKRFPGVLALDRVDFELHAGEIHSLVGQNGAGKSTLMKILAGDYPANEGQIEINEQPVSIRHNRDARRLGIGIVYQELSLLPNLSVADNVFLGREPGRLFIKQHAIERQAREVLGQLGISHIDVTTPVEALPLAEQQLVEIAKVLSYRPRILILDEPTAPLTQRDTDRLFAALHRLKGQGIGIIFITHRLQEVVAHSDRGTVLRNGRVVRVAPIREMTVQGLVESMIGQELEGFYRPEQPALTGGEPVLEVENLQVGDKVSGVNFVLRRGEVVGVTGLLGGGQNELSRALFGIAGPVAGTIRRCGRPVSIQSPRDAIALGICLLTENRKEEGLFLERSVQENITISSLPRFRISRVVPLISQDRERQDAQREAARVNVVARSLRAAVRTLSGGNQQKAILARWLLRNLEVLILIEPTRGIDVGAKAEVYRHLDRMAREGKTILVVSTEIPEILGISDRIFVMYKGQLRRVISRTEATEELVLAEVQGGQADVG